MILKKGVKMKTRMYAGTKTWNPYKGCEFDCIYCKPSFQKQAKRQKQLCDKCYSYEPHEHPERLHKIPNAEIIFVAGNGDISFANPKFIFKIIDSSLNLLETSLRVSNIKFNCSCCPWFKK